MAILEILTEPNAVLRKKSSPVTEITDETRKLMDDMLETMYAAEGIGLAAIQIGVPLRMIVMDLKGKTDEEPDPLYFINPEFAHLSESHIPYREGCLSVPGVYNDVNRPERVTVNYLDYHGKPQTLTAEGLLAVCIQHEYDHLEGVLFIDRLPAIQRDLAIKKLMKKQGLRLK